MAYDQLLADRIQQVLDEKKVNYEAKKMFGGIAYMVEHKMCVGIIKQELMARVGPEAYDAALKRPNAKEMKFTGRPMKGYISVEPDGFDLDEDLTYWVQLCLDFNPFAKASKKKKNK